MPGAMPAWRKSWRVKGSKACAWRLSRWSSCWEWPRAYVERCVAVERMVHSRMSLSSLGKNDCNRKKGKRVKETERDFGYAAQGGWNEICEGGVLGSGNLGIAGNHAALLHV